MPDHEMLTMEESAKALGIHLDSVRRYVRKNKIRGVVKRGRSYLAPRVEIERLKAGTPVTDPIESFKPAA